MDRPMGTHRRRRRSQSHNPVRAMALAWAWMFVCAAAAAQEARFAGRGLDEGHDLRTAFRDVVAEARQATVCVLIEDQPVALGAIVAADGWIVTKGSDLKGTLRCRLPDGRELAAEQRAYDRDTDLALLKIEAQDLSPIRWRTSGDPDVGEWLATVGQDPRPAAVGVVSVRRRAIAAERVSGVLGVVLDETSDGARIDEIIADSAAEQAQLQPGDVIMRVADRAVDSRRTLMRLIREYEPGTTLDLTIRRGNEELVRPATLTHPFGQFLSRIAAQNHMGGELSLRRSGFPAVLQHDTVLTPAECGGPLVDLDGAAVGLNIARAGRTESYALPADVVQAALERLRSQGTAEPQLASEPAPPAPADANPTSVEVAPE